MDHHQPPELLPEEKSIWDQPATIRIIWIVLIGGSLLFGAAGFVLAAQHKMHPHFEIDKFPAFYGVMGFVSFSFIVLAGQHLRKILMRSEDYYDHDAPEAPPADDHHGEGH